MEILRISRNFRQCSSIFMGERNLTFKKYQLQEKLPLFHAKSQHLVTEIHEFWQFFLPNDNIFTQETCALKKYNPWKN